MKYNKIILAGGSGYLGKVLAEYYSCIAKEVIILSRKPQPPKGNIKTVVWDGETQGAWIASLENAGMLVNLCGKNVNCRYNARNRAEIIRSRTVPTILLGTVISMLKAPPELWINVTSATIYRYAEDHPQDEMNGEIGYGFSIDVCRQWEAAFFSGFHPETRKIALRMGIVLGGEDGVFPRLLNLVKLGMGGKQGSGSQYISWIHEQDAARCTEWLLQHREIDGIVNCTSPTPVKNNELMSCIRNAYGIKFGMPIPACLLELGAALVGTETELILKSRWVLPLRLQKGGYPFLFSDIGHAIRDILSIRK